ncbi:MAG: amidohydrolase [Deltaproteobacteria bacterium]|nr:MAG: amidohydrolase [Deltaproteobacteria bacterium]TMB44084.1 MAG: amidohydrolase [Deltaproteobacteria bacterium]
MIADAHYHLDPRLESVEQLLAQMQVHAIGRVALIAAPCDPLQVGRAGAAFVRFMRRALEGGAPRLGRILYRSTVHRSGRVSFLSPSAPIYPEPDNDAVERAFSAHPHKFVGWIFLNPSAKPPVEEAERRFRNPGWIGVKAHPFWHRYPVAALDDVAALCQERDKPMLVHLGAGAGRGDFRRLPKRFPRLKLVYAHAGIPWYGTLWDDAIRRENVFVDLSSPYLDKALRHRALRALGASRCLYGSDGPYGYPGRDGGYDHGAILRQISQAGLAAQDLDRVLGGNFNSLVAV